MELWTSNSGWRTGTAGGRAGTALAALFFAACWSAHASSPPQGPQIFVDSGCIHCHGVTGTGTNKGPSLRDVRKRLSPEQMHQQIKNGGKSMPPFGEALSETEINQLVDYLRSRHAWKQPLPPASPPPPSP